MKLSLRNIDIWKPRKKTEAKTKKPEVLKRKASLGRARTVLRTTRLPYEQGEHISTDTGEESIHHTWDAQSHD